MYVTVKLNADVSDGTIVCHDSANMWRAATSADVAPLGVVKTSSVDTDGVRWAKVTLGGVAFARAGDAIPAQGGWLSCDDQGRAVVTTTEECGIIAPVSQGATAPSQDDLILVYLR